MRAEAAYHKGDAKLAEGDFVGAAAELKEAVRIDPSLVAAHHALGEAYLGLVRAPEAEAQFRQAISLEPKKYLSWMGLGQALWREGRLDAAAKAAKKAAELQPGSAQPHALLARIYRDMNRSDDAATEFESAAKTIGGKDGASLWVEAGDVLAKAKQWKRAAAAYRKGAVGGVTPVESLGEPSGEGRPDAPGCVVKTLPKPPAGRRAAALLDKLGNAYVRVGDMKKARVAYACAVKLSPKEASLWEILGSLDEALGHPKLAYADYQKAKDADSNRPTVWEGLGRLDLAAGRMDAARTDAYEALTALGDKQTGDDTVVENVASLLSKVGKHKQAAQLYQMLLADAPKDARLWTLLAVEQRADGSPGEAEISCTKARLFAGKTPAKDLAACKAAD